MLVLRLALVALVVLASCSSDSSSSEEAAGTEGEADVASTPTPFDGTTWLLTELPGRSAVTTGVEVTAHFADGAITGTAGCNRYLGTYRSTGDELTVEAGAATAMACPPPASDVERTYLDALNAVAGQRRTGTTLTLVDGGGDPVLSFTAMGVEALDGSWVVTSFHRGDAITSVDHGVTLTAVFDGGEVSGEGGCNRYSAEVAVDGPAITIGPVAASLRSCSDAVDQQEQAFFAALEEARGWSATPSTLELFRADGGYAAILARS